jgi:hypothetical protein
MNQSKNPALAGAFLMDNFYLDKPATDPGYYSQRTELEDQRQLSCDSSGRLCSSELHHTDGDGPEQIRDGDFVSVT